MSNLVPGPRQFLPTRWSLVRRAFDEEGDVEAGKQALGELIERYWGPVYAYLRRRGEPAERAQDLTQGFFTSLLERGLGGARPELGSFRGYLLGALKHYVTDDVRREASLRRGGDRQRQPLAAVEQEASRWRDAAPEAAFARRWAEEMIERALARLERELVSEGQQLQLAALRLSVAARPPSYQEMATLLGVEVSAVTNHLHRGRQAFRRALRAELLPGVIDAAHVEDELAELMAALAD